MKSLTLYTVLTLFVLTASMPESETFTRQGETLIFSNTDKELSSEVKQKLVGTFFKVYPKMKRDFNTKALDTIHVKVDTSYDGVAYANNGRIVISSEWLHKKPGDTDVITHEAMHIIQNYPGGAGPGWLTEGIADYVRYKYGINNAASGWALPNYSEDSHYTDSYRTTARFLVWLEKNHGNNIVRQLDEKMRNQTYSDSTWKDLTGQSLDKLWQEYSIKPNI